MTDATSPANGHAPGTESAQRIDPDRDGTSEYGMAREGEAPKAPDFGQAPARLERPGVTRPAGWFLSAPGEAAPPGAGTEPARTDAGPWAARWPEPADRAGPAGRAVPEPHGAAGPTAAPRGRAEDPGLAVPAGAPGPHDPARRSCWQLSHGVWRDVGIDWEPAVPAPPAFTPAPPASATLPLGAPALADAPALAWPRARSRFEIPLPAAWPRLAEPPDPAGPYHAWRRPVRRAAAPLRLTARRRAAAWQVVRVGVPAAVIVTVGAGAVMMLTGTAGGILAGRAHQSGSRQGPASGAAAPLAGGTFPGYPGQQGPVTVSSIVSADGTRLAVGGADGHPAIWSRAADGTWRLVSASSPAVYQRPGVANLTSVAHGPAGWLAVGDVISGAARQPVAVTSADGVTWHPLGDTAAFTGPGAYVTGVTAGRNGYVVVGRRAAGGRVFAAMWWSASLRGWVSGDNGGLDGRLEPSAAYAVAATADGFIAVGSHGTCHAVWTSPDGQHWSVYDVPVPPGASSAALRFVATDGTRAVAAGYAVTKAGDVPIVVVSADGGRHWRQIVLPAPGGGGAVTALTAAGAGFVAAGQAGPAGAARAVTWRSPDGLTWPAPIPATGGVRQITALSSAGGTVTGAAAAAVTGTAQQGAAPSLITIPAVP